MMKLSRREWAWALYDVANSAFFTTIVAGFFPVFFKQYWGGGQDAITTTYDLALASSAASLVVALVAPFIGATSDTSPLGRWWLGGFSVLAVLCCCVLAWLPQGEYGLSLWVFAVASVAAACAITVYDALLTVITSPQRYHRVSVVGYALGYLGGGVLFSVNVWMTLQPHVFGLEGKVEAVQASFMTVGVWWLLWMLPLLWLAPARWSSDRTHRSGEGERWGQSLKGLYKTLQQVRQRKPVWLFLIAYWLYIDGVGTVMRMAVDYGMSLGFEASHLMIALLIVQFVGFPATLVFISISQRWGAKRGIYLGIIIYGVITLGAYFMHRVEHFYILAVGVALAQGGLQALSRSYFAQLIPKDHAGQYFGFYNTFGKFAAIFGPILMGGVAMITQSHRLSILSILCLFVLAGLVMRTVRSDSEDAVLSSSSP